MATNQKTNIVDPNNTQGINSFYSNTPVNLEDLTIYVELSATKKGRTMLTTDKSKNTGSSTQEVYVNFIDGSNVNGRKFLTTKYSDLTTSFDGDNNNEALGITSIDIDFNSQIAPQITIQFVDLRGSAIFQNENFLGSSENKYSIFFELPYPLYKLRIKGYYGQAVDYCLHMTKFTSRFNSQTGNFEITATFIGHTYAMLSDMLLGYLRAIPYTDLGSKKYEQLKQTNSNLLTLDELYEKISIINDITRGVSQNSSNYALLKTGEDKKEQLKNIYTLITNYVDGFNNNKNKLDYSFLIFEVSTNKDNFFGYQSAFNQRIGDNITTFNENNKFDLNSATFKVDQNNLYFTGLYKDLVNDTKYSDALNCVKANKLDLADGTPLYIVDNRTKIKTITDLQTSIDTELTKVKVELQKELETEVTKEIGFVPSVRNIINIITSSIEVFTYCIYEVSSSASKNEERKNLFKKVFNQKNTDIPPSAIGLPSATAANALAEVFYPWPEYSKKVEGQSYEETYLGTVKELSENVKSIDELQFIDDLFNAFIFGKKRLDSLQKNIQQEKNGWFSVNPLDSIVYDNTAPYSRINPPTGPTTRDDLIRLIVLRAITFLGYSNNPNSLTEEDIQAMVDSEVAAIKNDVKNTMIVDSLNNLSSAYYLTVTGKISGVDTPILLQKNNSYVYNYILQNENIKAIPINSNFSDSNWNPKNLGITQLEYLTTQANAGINFLTNYTYSPIDKNKPYDGGVYLRIIDKDYFNENYKFPKETANGTLNLAKLKNNENPGFNVLGPSIGIQSFKYLDYDKTGSDGKDIKNFDYRYIFYAYDSTYSTSNFSNGLCRYRQESNNKTFIFDNSDFKDGKWEPKENGFKIASESFNKNGYKDAIYHKDYGKNLVLINDSNIKKSYPFIDFCVIESNTIGNNITPISLFGSRFYYEQTSDESKAFLFLHTFPWNGLLGEDTTIFDTIEILRTFNERAGVVSVPKAWVYFLGGILWRAEQVNIDPIKFGITNQNGIFESFIPNVKNNFPTVTQYLSVSGYKQGMSFKDTNFIGGNANYKNIDNILVSLPEQAKKELIGSFTNFVSNEWQDLKNQLEILDTTLSGWVSTYNLITQNIPNNYISKNNSEFIGNTNEFSKVFNLNNYVVLTPLLFNPTYNYNYWLELKDDSDINNALVSFYSQETYLANMTYRIWKRNNVISTSDSFAREDIAVNQNVLRNYLNKIADSFKGNTETLENKKKEEAKQSLFGTTNEEIIKLQLYRTCKNVYDKWVANASDGDSVLFQCGNRNPLDAQISALRNDKPRLIDSFRFLTRSFKDIGDKMAINPLPLQDYLSDNIDASAFDAIGSILASNNFNFTPLPSFINYKDKDVLDSIFKTFPTFNDFSVKDFYGPTFVCVYVGASSKHLDFGGSNYKNDGFDFVNDSLTTIPEDFTGTLQDGEEPVTVFKVAYSHQNQNIFKDIVLDQGEFGETAEGLMIQDNISQTGSQKYKTLGGQNFYNVYSVRQYKAEVEMMGNAMIQPMMYFQLDNIPMFHGAYMITRVKHSIKPNSMSTNFTGVRIKSATTPIYDIGSFYMSLLTSLEKLESSLTDVEFGSTNGVFEPIIVTLNETGALNGYFGNVIPENQLKSILPLPAGIQKSVKLKTDNCILIPQAADSLKQMLTDWVSWMKTNKFKGLYGDGKIYAQINDAFRTQQQQQELFDKNNGKGVAPVGTSKHGWGIAVDFQFFRKNGEIILNRINLPDGKTVSNVEEGFDYTKNESIVWLLENGYKYGWILPEGLRSFGSYDEFWHFEYHGRTAACILTDDSKNTTVVYRGPTKNKGSKNVTIDQQPLDIVKNPINQQKKEATYTGCKTKKIGNSDGTPDALKTTNPNIIVTPVPPQSDIDFYTKLLNGIRAPITQGNLYFLYAWAKAEGNTATFNPLSSTQPLSEDKEGCYYNCLQQVGEVIKGVKPEACRKCPDGSNPGVRKYKTAKDGIEATIKNLTNGKYPKIVDGLRNNIGYDKLSKLTDELGRWGTGKLINEILSANKMTYWPITTSGSDKTG